jgi:capsular polysaccharide biosynthesis protein/Mrp family chromosome partitioning ATPase
MTEGPKYASLQDYLRVLKSRWWLIALVTIVFTAIAVGVTLKQKTTYQAQTSLAFIDVTQNANLISSNAIPPSASPDIDPNVQAETISRAEIVRQVKHNLGRHAPPGALSSPVTAFVENPTKLVVIQVQSSDAKVAAQVANAYANAEKQVTQSNVRAQLNSNASALTAQFRSLPNAVRADPATGGIYVQELTRLRYLASTAQPVQVIRTASVPTAPVSPDLTRNALLGLLVGLALGILAAFLGDALDRRVRAPTELDAYLDWPILGTVRRGAMGRVGLVSGNGRGPTRAGDFEDFRIVRKNIQFLDREHPPASIVVTSAVAEEGKTTVAASLACANALAGKLTLLVEGDLRRPALAQRMGVAAAPGLTDYLAGDAAPADILHTVSLASPPASGSRLLPWRPSQDAQAGAHERGNGAIPARGAKLVVITAGTPTTNPAEVLGSDGFRSFLESVTETYDLVILDSSPLLSVADTLELVPQADATLVCVRASKTTLDEASAVRATLSRLPSKPVGVVVTGVRRSVDSGFDYYAALPAKSRQKAASTGLR